MKRLKNEGGFTLIELIVVIVILGVLAVIAVPKYMDIRKQAEQGTANGVTAALRGAIAIAHAKYLMDNTETYDNAAIVANLETEDVEVSVLGTTGFTASFPSGNIYTWSYTDDDTTDDLPAKVADTW